MTDPTDRLRSELEGRYEIVRELDRGGMAIVYVARDARHDRQVAIKVLKPELVTSVGAERFLREIRIAAGLEHPNILAVHDSGASGEVLWYAMPFVEGASLRDRLDFETQLSIPETIAIARQVASALGHAHGKGIIHRDIKPANILLSDGAARVADFGIATALESAGESSLTETGLSLGTPLYMSPEQAGGTERIDGRSDIYSLGCVIYEALTGNPPFLGKTSAAIMARHSMDPVPPVRSVRQTIPPSLEQAVLRSLAKVPADRFGTTDELIDALNAAEAEGITISGVEMPALPAGRSVPVSQATTQASPARSSSGARIGGRWWALGIIAAGAVVAVSFMLGRGGIIGAAELDPNRVVVFPLASGDPQSPAGSGENAATMIGHALDGVGPLRWIDGWKLLEEDERSAAVRVEPERWNQLARDQGARYVVAGRIIPARDDSVIVALELVDASSAETIARGEGIASRDVPWQAGLTAVNSLLPSLIPGAESGTVSNEWTGFDPGAVAAFLLGEQAFRRGQFVDAAGHHETAVSIDSSFVLAALRAAQTYTWMDGGGVELARASALAGLVRSSASELPDRYRHYAAGFEAFLEGRGGDAAESLRATIAADPGMAIAWLQLGEVFRHLPPTEAYPDSLAEDAYMRAHGLDTVASATVYHLLEIAIRRGDVSEARRLLGNMEAAGADSSMVMRMTEAVRCVEAGPDSAVWSSFAEQDPANVQRTGWMLLKGGAQIPCGRAAIRALLSRAEQDVHSQEALMAEATLLIAAGDDSAASELIAWGIGAVDAGTSRRLALFLATATGRLQGMAAGIADYYWTFYGDDYLTARDTGWLHLFGAYEAGRGRLEVATRILEEIERRAAESRNSEEQAFAEAMAGHVALAEGDSARALSIFSDLAAGTPAGERVQWHVSPPLGLEFLLAARLYLAAGQDVAAIDAASYLDSQAAAYYFPLLQPSLEIRIDAAERRADDAAANNYSTRLAGLTESD